MFDEDEASRLASLAMYNTDDTPEYDALIKKLLAHRYSEQDYSEKECRLIVASIDERLRDTEEYVAPSYDSPPFSSFAVSDISREREILFDLRERILQRFPQLLS